MKFMIIMIASLLASPGFAEDNALEEREARSTVQINEIGKIERSYGYFDTSTREYFLGAKGVKAMAESWLTDSYAWLTEMNQLPMLLDAIDERSFLAAVTQVERTYQKKELALADLSARASAIEAAARRGQQLLDRSRAVPNTTADDLAPVSSLLAASRAHADEGFAKISISIAQRLADLTTIQQESRPLVIEKLKRAMIRAGIEHLQTRLDEAAATLLYIERAVPLIRQLEAFELSMGRYAIDLAYYQAQDTLKEAEAACTAFDPKLTTLNLPSQLAQRARERQAVVCAGIRGHWADLSDHGATPARMVYEYAKVQAANYRAECQTAQPTINCEKLAVLRSFSPESLTSLSADRLRFYEYAWSPANLSL